MTTTKKSDRAVHVPVSRTHIVISCQITNIQGLDMANSQSAVHTDTALVTMKQADQALDGQDPCSIIGNVRDHCKLENNTCTDMPESDIDLGKTIYFMVIRLLLGSG